MKLIADSGSSKTDWRFIDSSGNVFQFESQGLNPYFHTEETIQTIVQTTFESLKSDQPTEVYFYGAGCSSASKNELVEKAIANVFPRAKVYVAHDLLGAARAACGRTKGLAAILGTGSNACVFDGKQITESFPSGGYLLADEGGGVHLGREVLKAYIEHRLPEELAKKFYKRYPMKPNQLLKELYGEEFPNRYMATYSFFVFHHRNHPFMSGLIQRVLGAFFENQLLRFEESKSYPINFVGSVAFYYQDFLYELAGHYQLKIGNIIEKPISALCLYHQRENEDV